MKRFKISFAVILVVVGIMLAMFATSLNARATLARDPNGTAIQFCRSFTTAADTVVTVSDSIAVPANTVLATILAKDQIIYWKHGGKGYTTTTWVQLPAGIPITIPVSGNSYICFKSYTGTAKVYFIWHKM